MEVSPGVPLDQLPGLKPPPGVLPNFVNPPESYQNTIVATMAVCLAVATLASAARLYTNVRIVKSVAMEDCMTSIALQVFSADRLIDACYLAWVRMSSNLF